MGKAVNIEYSIDVTVGGITSKTKVETSIPEGDLEFFVEKYGAKVKGAFAKAFNKKEDEPKKKESKKSNNKNK